VTTENLVLWTLDVTKDTSTAFRLNSTRPRGIAAYTEHTDRQTVQLCCELVSVFI